MTTPTIEPSAKLGRICDRVCAAAQEFMNGVERTRAELDGTVGDLFLRSLQASPFWMELCHACSEWRRERRNAGPLR